MGVRGFVLHTGQVRTGLKALAATASAALMCAALVAPVGAVTYGTAVSDPGKTAPWVVRILFADTGVRTSDAFLLCSGSLLDSRTVLTAGHCVDDSTLSSGYYYIQPAGQLGGTADRVPVDASWYNPGFDPNTLHGDVSLLHLARPIVVSKYAQLPTTSVVPRTLHLYGFGENESHGLPGQLWTTTMHPASASDINRLDQYNQYDAHTMIAAVNYNDTTGNYSGGCHGDSGGPLTATVKGKAVLFGVVSWGEPDCIGTASAFARVSSLVSAIQDGRALLPTLAKQQYRGRPENTVAPTISGWTGAAGATLTCHAGSWTNHPGSYQYRWYTRDAVPGTDPSVGHDSTYVVQSADVKYPVQCVVFAYSALSSNNANVLAATVNAHVKPVVESVAIDVGNVNPPTTGATWTCSAIAGGLIPVTALLQTARTFSWTASNGVALPQAKRLVWTPQLVQQLPAGTTLTCTITVTNAHSNGVATTLTSVPVTVNP